MCIRDSYKAKSYSDDWIEKRVRGIAVRQELTDEWKKRGVKEGKEHAILTNEISKATFGKTVEEFKEFKGLKKENLRDHMFDLEIIFTMLGEASTTKIARSKNAQGFVENKSIARKGGKIAGDIDTLFLVKDLWERTLIYGRYGAKALPKGKSKKGDSNDGKE